jgi:hypothetical protein
MTAARIPCADGLRQHEDKVDRLEIEIVFRERKDYVFKVVKFYNAYRTIYPDQG